MIQLTSNTTILLAVQPVDFRKGIDGLAALCRNQLSQQPTSGELFLFINRNKTMIRALSYDGTGFWLMTKRLSKGRFNDWPKSAALLSSLQARQLRVLLQDKRLTIETGYLQ